MSSALIKTYIRKAAKQDCNIVLPKNYNFDEVLSRYIAVGTIAKKRIVFSWCMDSGSCIMNGSPMVPGCILFNAAWAARIVLHDSPSTMNAFLISVGHELTHKEKELCKIRFNKVNRKFISWVNEVHADFSGCEKMVSRDRRKLCASCENKKEWKMEHEPDIDTDSHPSWDRRTYYAEYFNFNEQLIEQIAVDVHCENKALISKACSFYKPVILLP